MKTAKSRPEAKSIGAIKYFTGNPCPQGHIALRITSNGTCEECSKIQSKKQSKSGYYKARYDEKRNEILEKNRERHRKMTPEQKSAYSQKCKKWQDNNEEKVRSIKRNYKTKRRIKERAGVSTKKLHEWTKAQPKICFWCFTNCESGYHIDHVIPLSKGGKHQLKNLAISCPHCNLRKNAKEPSVWIDEMQGSRVGD